MSVTPKGFVNPLGRNPFLCPKDTDGMPKLTERELETAMRAYCRVWGIPIPKGKARAKAIGKPSGSPVPRGVADSYLAGQLHAFTPS